MWFRNNSGKVAIDAETNTDYYQITIDIKNFKPLTHKQLEFIKTLPVFNQFEIIQLYNHCHNFIDEVLKK